MASRKHKELPTKSLSLPGSANPAIYKTGHRYIIAALHFHNAFLSSLPAVIEQAYIQGIH
jgi:hypothetical protein